MIPNETRISRSDGQTGVSGRRGNQLENPKYQRSRNPPVTINGREFSGHALDQMQNRGIPPSAVENAIKPGNLFSTNEAKGTYGYFDKSNDLRVITNIQSGRVVTVIPGSP
ncbi:DUF4258 domain-containing protein [Acidiphilium angustum]|uniref:DUF4258 domain-containing protein n=1 Tax=Acidiphilium angustum TaxID=523 RepID=UPI001FE10B28|nr:DUF4258 domain-containing protein [Acidiphilium angustum]